MSDEQNKARIRVGLPTQVVPASNIPIFYTNIAGLVVSPEEVAINFGLVNPEKPEELANVARVYMTPGHAKRLSLALQRTIEKYEESFGVIRSPEDLLTPEMRKQVGLPDK